MTSSNRGAGVCDAVLMKGDEIVGPLRLPSNRVDDFISQFNRIYAELTISLLTEAGRSRNAFEQKTVEQKKSSVTRESPRIDHH